MSVLVHTVYTEAFTTIVGNWTKFNAFINIGVFDGATGNPIDGNGLNVVYAIDQDDVPGPERTTKIIGQTRQITGGVIRIVDNNTGNVISNTTIRIISYDTVVPGTPPASPNVCDLAVSNINLDKKESDLGANDARVTITGYSTHGPIQYSLDNITFQLSGTFSGLSGGAQTVYLKDGAGCTLNKAFNVDVTRNLLVSDPSITRSGNVSRWNAAFNPVFFNYQRKDFEVTGIAKDGNGFAVVAVNGNLVGLLVDDLVYVNAGTVKGTYRVKSAVTGSNVQLDLQIAAPIIQGGFINVNRLRPYYEVQTEITYLDRLSGSFQKIKSSNRPNNTGLVKADISSFLQSLLKVVDESNYTVINFRDDNLSASYTIRFAEVWEGNSPVFISLSNPYYILYAAKQLQEEGGGNLINYVPFKNNSLAKWLTDFTEPAYSYGFPFDIGFIYGEDLAGEQIYYKTILLDINRNQLNANPVDVGLLNEDGSYLLNQDATKLLIAKQNLLSTPVVEHVGLNRLLINSNYNPLAWYIKIALFYDVGSVPKQVTEYQTIRIDKAGEQNSVYLRWIGLSGSWNYYRFIYDQEVSLDVQNAVTIKNFVGDWANQNTIEDVISKAAGQKMKVMAEDLSVIDIKGLQSIKYSPKVQMLVNKNPVKWQTVVVNTATFSEFETQLGHYPFTITFNLPSINIQTQ